VVPGLVVPNHAHSGRLELLGRRTRSDASLRRACGECRSGASTAFDFLSSFTELEVRPAFSDYAHFALLSFFFQCAVRYLSNALLPSYMTYTSSRIYWSFRTSYRVCLVPPESDSNGAYSAGAVASQRQSGVVVPHTAGVGSRMRPMISFHRRIVAFANRE